MQFVVLFADDALAELVLEVEVFAPVREDVLEGDASTDFVGLIVAHEAEVGVDGGADVFEVCDLVGVCGVLAVEAAHGGDEGATGAVGHEGAGCRDAGRTDGSGEGAGEELGELAGFDLGVVDSGHCPLAEVEHGVEPCGSNLTGLDNGADDACALGPVLEIDLVRVERDVQLVAEVGAGLGEESASLLTGADEGTPVVDEDDEVLDLLDEDDPLREDGADEVGPDLRGEIADGEAVHVEQAFARWQALPHRLGRFAEEIVLAPVEQRGVHHVEESRLVGAGVLVHDDLLEEFPDEGFVERHEEIGEVAADDPTVITGEIVRELVERALDGGDGPEGAIATAAVHGTVADIDEIFLDHRAEAKIFPVVGDTVAEGAGPHFAEDGHLDHKAHRCAGLISSRAHRLPELHEVAGGVPPELRARVRGLLVGFAVNPGLDDGGKWYVVDHLGCRRRGCGLGHGRHRAHPVCVVLVVVVHVAVVHVNVPGVRRTL